MSILLNEDLDYHAGLTELQKLQVGWCTSVSDQDVLSLSSLTNLTELELARTKVRTLCHPHFSCSVCSPQTCSIRCFAQCRMLPAEVEDCKCISVPTCSMRAGQLIQLITPSSSTAAADTCLEADCWW